MKRNNIVSLLMDKVPRRNKEGYAVKTDTNGSFIIVEMEDFGDVYNFLRNHNVFGNIPGRYVTEMVDTMVMGATEHTVTEPGNMWPTTTYLLKFRVTRNGTQGYTTPFSDLALRHARTFVIVHEGKRDPNFIERGKDTSTITREQLAEEAAFMQVLSTGMPKNLEYQDYDHDLHKLVIE